MYNRFSLNPSSHSQEDGPPLSRDSSPPPPYTPLPEYPLPLSAMSTEPLPPYTPLPEYPLPLSFPPRYAPPNYPLSFLNLSPSVQNALEMLHLPPYCIYRLAEHLSYMLKNSLNREVQLLWCIAAILQREERQPSVNNPRTLAIWAITHMNERMYAYLLPPMVAPEQETEQTEEES